MPSNLILDIGNVICEWNPSRLAAMTVEDPLVQQQLLRATVEHGDWLELDKGALTLSQAIDRAQDRSGLGLDLIANLYSNLGPSLALLPGSVEAMKRAKEQGIPLYILSNMPLHAWEYLHAHHECFHWCQGVVVSAEAQLLKPDPAIYHYLCKRFSLVPDHCMFIDDRIENVDAAISCGLHSVQLQDPAQGGVLIDQVVDTMRHH